METEKSTELPVAFVAERAFPKVSATESVPHRRTEPALSVVAG
jgi:hypothetical protein